VKQAMKKVFAGFAAHGKATGDVCAGAEAALDGITNSFVFVLHFFADFYAGLIFLFGLFADVRKVVVEDNRAFVDSEREDEIRVHDSFVGVEHEIRIDPEIKSAALARGGDVFFRFRAGAERARLQARALEIFDGVVGVFDDAAEAFVCVGT